MNGVRSPEHCEEQNMDEGHFQVLPLGLQELLGVHILHYGFGHKSVSMSVFINALLTPTINNGVRK